ncbi:hypothetical protein BGZ76_007717 [Entomortierella beljakovae]|nr:hypothetical protein BGZ76_007717 [Entomortierella beljakovae]
MEEYLSSSEAFAKALKGFQVSPSDKIRLAKEAWSRPNVVLPHKQEFLLEWICSALSKASAPAKNAKDESLNVLLDQEYWDLFKDMLNGISTSNKKKGVHGYVSTRNQDGIVGSAGIADNFAPSVLLRAPVIPIFTAIIQRVAPIQQPTQPEITSSKEKKSKAKKPAAPTQNSPLDTPSETLLESVLACFSQLSSMHMVEWFQPTIEQYTPLAQAILDTLVEMTRESSDVSEKKQTLILAMAHIVLDRFKRMVLVQPNQKKVFTLVAGKMFEGLVRTRVAIQKLPGSSTDECLEAIGAIIRNGLFHQEHLQEYTTGYSTGDEITIQSYQKQLFENIAALIKSEYSVAVLEVLPILLRFFVEESRRKQKSLANSGFERGADGVRESEFTFFKIVYILARKQLPSLTEDPSESHIEELANIMEAHNGLLATILELNMYQPSNDETADQFVFMSSSFGSIYSCLTTAKKLGNGRLQSISLTGIVVLAQLDDRLLKPHLDSLWPILFSPIEGANDAALKLADTLLDIYGRASDLKALLSSLFSSLRDSLYQPDELKASPLFSKPFLDSIPANIRNYLPLPQAPMILDIFATELITLDSGMEIEKLEPIQESGHKKKRKLNTGKSKDQGDRAINTPTAEYITAIFIQFLRGLRVTANQEKQLNKEFKTVYDYFLKPTFEKLVSKDAERSELYQASRLTPALKLYYTICKISSQFWENGISGELLHAIVKSFKQSSSWTDATVLTLNRVVLQHVHLTLCSSKILSNDHIQSCRELVNYTMESSRLNRLLNDDSLVVELWDGRLESASGNAFLVASWQIQVNDWLDIVCRFGTTQHMELIAQVITKQFGQSWSDTPTEEGTISIHLLNQILLRSANFYEVPNFRPIFAQTVLHRLAESITALSITTLEKDLSSMVSSFTGSGDPHSNTSNKATFLDALKKLVEISQEKQKKIKKKMEQGAESTTKQKQGKQLLSMLSIMHLLPLEYFEKYERNIILTTMAVLEHFIQNRLDPDATGIKCLLLCRHIANSIMTWRSDAGILSHGPELLLPLLDYPIWNCSSNYGSEDSERIGYAIMESTCSMLDHAVRYYMWHLHDATQYESAYIHLVVLLDKAQEWAQEDLTISKTSFSNQLTVPSIRVGLLSRLYRSIVQCLESHTHHKKSKSKANPTISSTTSEDMNSKQDSIRTRIESLFTVSQSKVATRIEAAVSFIKPGSQLKKDKKAKSESTFITEALESMDHFEIFKTILDYGQFGDDSCKKKCLRLIPDIFCLAKSLTQESLNHSCNSQSHNPEQSLYQNLIHLSAILSGYSCQYMPQSETWTPKGSEETLKELLVLLFKVSRLDLLENDVAVLKNAYLSMLGSLSEDQFEIVLQWSLEETYTPTEDIIEGLVLVRYLDATFLGVHHTHKRRIRRQISRLLTRLTQILQHTQSVQLVVGTLDIMAGICSEPSFELRSWEVGLVLEGITSLMSPATPLLLNGARTPSSSSSQTLTNRDTSSIFTALYHVLINTARFRQEELTALIPVFTAIIQGIFHGFKSLHASIAKRQQGVESLIKSPFMLLSAGSIHSTANVKDSSKLSAVSDFTTIGDPLPVECAENFSRLLTALGSKGVTPLGSHGNYHSNNTDATGSSSGGSSAISADATKAYGKHAPYILMEYFTIQCSIVASISQQNLRSALLPGLYTLLSVCSDWEREMMMVGLDNTGKTLLKDLYADYLKYHKYTGR